MLKSSIKDLLLTTKKEVQPQRNFTLLDIDDLMDAFHDGITSFGERKQIFKELEKRDPDLAREQITNLCRNFEESGSKDQLSFICFMLDYTLVDIFMKLECALTLYNSKYSGSKNYFLSILSDYKKAKKELRPSVTIYIDVLRYLLVNIVDDNVKKHIDWFLSESELPVEFIYKTIISIQRDEERKVSRDYLDYLYSRFFETTKSDNYKVLAGQYLLQYLPSSDVEKRLLSIARNESTPYNLRADSADVLIKLGTKTMEQAKKIITELGKDTSGLKTVYTNRQNVHVFEESTNKFLLSLGGTKLDTVKENDVERCITFEDMVGELMNTVKQSKYKNKLESIKSSLIRIQIDQIIYPGSQSLATIFIKIMSIINKHEYKDTLTERLIEELIDMHDTCSSGHASRLVNVFSGVDNFNHNIGFRRQIQGNIYGRLTALIKNIEDEETRDEITLQLNNPEFSERYEYSKFLRENIGSIYDELKAEFTGLLSEEDFELYFRQGMNFIETGNTDD